MKAPRPFLSALLLGSALLLSACSARDIPGVYRIDVQQGNVVTEDMLARLEPGMSRRRVLFVLGTPLIADTFNADRWDYLYSFTPGSGERVQRRISVFFEGESLVRVDGDVQAALTRTVVPERRDQVVKIEGPGEPPGLLRRLNPFAGDGDRPAPADEPESAPAAAPEPTAAPEPSAISGEDPPSGEAATQGARDAVAAPASPAQTDPARPASATPAESESEEEGEDGGFFQRLRKRFAPAASNPTPAD